MPSLVVPLRSRLLLSVAAWVSALVPATLSADASAEDRKLIRPGGRIQLDAGFFDGDVQQTQDLEFRRLRLQASGDISARLSYFAHYDLTDGEPRPIDLWARYQISRRHVLTIGNQITPLGLDAMTSSLDTWFTERALPTALTPGYRLGVQWRMRQDHWSLMTGISGGRLRKVSELDSALQRSGGGVTARVAVTPFDGSGNRVVHLGLASDLRSSDASGVRLRARPESNLADRTLVNTGRMRNTGAIWTTGLELGVLYDRFALQSEFIQTSVSRSDRADPRFWGGYMATSYMVFGEMRGYSKTNRRLRRYTTEHEALELALRFSTLDLESEGVTGGVQSNVTGAIHLYKGRWRWSANYTAGRAAPDRRGDRQTLGILTVRAQYRF